MVTSTKCDWQQVHAEQLDNVFVQRPRKHSECCCNSVRQRVQDVRLEERHQAADDSKN